MLLSCGLMDGVMWDAVLQRSTEGDRDDHTTVVLSNEEVLSPADAEFGEFAIVAATPEERETLKQAGYSMPDWSPVQGLGCGGCHAEGPEDVGQSDDPNKRDG
jgi:hypothetical protein